MELEDESVKSGQPQEPDHSPEVEGEESKEKLQKLVATHRDQLDKIMAEMADATKKNIHLAGDIQRKDNEINGLKCHIEAQKATVDDTRKKLAETDTFLITLQERLAISMNSLSEEKETSVRLSYFCAGSFKKIR
jgi:chromosome segregation ATPase